MEVASSSSSSEGDDDNEPLIKKLCMPQNAPESASEYLNLPKFPEGAFSLTPRMKGSKAAMFSTLATWFAPLDKNMALERV